MDDADIKKYQLYIHQRVIVDPVTGCWNWTKVLFKNGYGCCRFSTELNKPKSYYVHRLSYQVFIGPIPVGLLIRHNCHNKSCCNPAHLLVGTQQDNIDDLLEQGNGRHKLTKQQILLILNDYKLGSNMNQLADKYGVSAGTIHYHLSRAGLRESVSRYKQKVTTNPYKEQWSENQIQELGQLIRDNKIPYEEIAEQWDIDMSTMMKIVEVVLREPKIH